MSAQPQSLREKQVESALATFLLGSLMGAGGAGIGALLGGFDPESAGELEKPETTVEVFKPRVSRTAKPAQRGQYKFSSEDAVIPDSEIPPFDPQRSAPIGGSALTLPLLLGAGTAGAYTGFSGMNWLVDKYKEYRAQSELDAAREEYDELLQERYGLAKSSALAGLIDNGYDSFEKTGGAGEDLSQALWGIGGGSAMTLGAGLWLLSHMATKAKADKGDEARTRRKLLEQRLTAERAFAPPRAIFQLKDASASAGQDSLDEIENLMEPGTVESSGMKLNHGGLSQDQVDTAAGKIGATAGEAAADKETGNALTSGLMANADAAQQGITEALNPAVGGYLNNSLLGSVLGK